MFFFISKILSFLYSPAFWIFFLLVFSLIFFNNKKKLKLNIICSLVFYFIFSNSFIVDEVMRLWEMPLTTEVQTEYDAGILLGGGMVTLDAKTQRLIFLHNTDRFLQTLKLYKEKRIKKIIIAGGAGCLLFPNIAEAPLLKKYLLDINIPEKDIYIDSLSNNTYQNALYTKEIIEKSFSKKGKYLLITSAVHMRRSLACFKKLEIDVTPYTTTKHSGERRYQIDHLLMPNHQSFGYWEEFNHEFFGYIAYGVMGYL